MSSISQKSTEFLTIVLFLQLIVDVTVILNIPVARQIMGFAYFTFVPGLLIIKILKMNKLSFLETILLSAGLSVAFLLLLGLFINSLLPLFNIARPLSIVPLIVIFNIVAFIGALLAFLRNAGTRIFDYRISMRYLLLIALLTFLPILSIVGAIFANVYSSNLILLIMIILVSIVFAFLAIFRRLSFSHLYPFIIFIIAISLLFHSSLVSNYPHGGDTAAEYLIMSNTHTNSIWNQVGPYPNNDYWGRLNSMLSLTILPSIYASLLNINITTVYMILFPLIFSLVPVVLFQICQKYIGSKYAFIAAFFLMAEPTFYTEMLGLTRQMIAEVFFVLIFLVLLKKDMKRFDTMLCFALLGFGLVVSHYALAEIFLFFICLTFVVVLLFQRFANRRINANISITMILFFFVIMFSWYVFTSSSSVFNSFLTFGQHVINQISDFANPTSRGQTVLLGLGLSTPPPTIWNSISRIFAYLTEAFIIIGFIGLIIKRIGNNYDRTYTVLTSLSIILLATLILVPGLAATLNMSRFYHVLLFFMAPLCVLGAELVAKIIHKRRILILSSLLLVVVITGYFLFQTGFVYELTGTQNFSLPLNEARFGPFLSYWGSIVTEQEVIGAQWLSHYDNIGVSRVYAGYETPLLGYGTINATRIIDLSNTTEPKAGDFAYLGTFNTHYNVIYGFSYVWNTTDIQNTILSSSSTIYSSGYCEINKFISTP